MDHSSKIIAPWKIRELRSLRDRLLTVDAASRSAPGPTRIYLSRKRAAVRRVVNEAGLTPLLEEAGFSIIQLDSLPWTEQVLVMSNADVILAPHGAALANIVFCRAGTLVTEIATRSGYLDFYLNLAASAGLRYHFIEAQPEIPARRQSSRPSENEDMILGEDGLKNFLRHL